MQQAVKSAEELPPKFGEMSDTTNKFMLMAERAFKQRDAAQAKLTQIATVCRDNAAPSCKHDMALKFIKQIAEG
jgi:uncharacterized protein YlxP (DUF503 family)